jgi:hypothetical protein
VIDAGGALLEQRCDQYDAIAACGYRQFFGGRTGDGLGKIEQRVIFTLAEILGLKKFGQADDFRTAASSVGNSAESLLQILFRLWSA